MENTEQNAVKILPFESISQVANKSINYIKARKNHSIVSLKTRRGTLPEEHQPHTYRSGPDGISSIKPLVELNQI